VIIKVGDKVEIRRHGNELPKDGLITNISISTNAETDPAGENGPSVKELDLSMNYAGSIGYTDITWNEEGDETGDSYWAYFGQIIQPEGKNKKQWWEDKIYYGKNA